MNKMMRKVSLVMGTCLVLGAVGLVSTAIDVLRGIDTVTDASGGQTPIIVGTVILNRYRVNRILG